VSTMLVLVAGCGGGGDSEPPEPTVEGQEAASSQEAVVSVQTTCDMLFLQGKPPLWNRAVDTVATYSNNDLSAVDDAAPIASELEQVGESAEPKLQPHVAGMAETLRSISEGTVSDFTSFRTAGTEVANICAPYVAMDY
jgi:hypothetical protein